MGKTTEFIDREKARAIVCSLCRWEGTSNCNECEHPIEDIHAADVRPVVLCRDCKHADFAGMGNGAVWCYKMERAMQGEDFCSYGEKREES